MSIIITQQLNLLKSIESKIFICTQELEKALITGKREKHIDKIEKLISEIDFFHHNNELNTLLNSMKKTISYVKKVNKKKSKKDEMQQYAKYTIDPKSPIIVNSKLRIKIASPTFQQLQDNSFNKTGAYIKPIARRSILKYKGPCTYCGAPNEYIYCTKENNFLCKCCDNRFTLNVRKHAELSVICPYCDHTCDMQKDKDNYLVYKCRFDNCPYFLNNKKLVKKGLGEHLKVDCKYYKLHYIYRYHKTNLNELYENDITVKNGLNIGKLHHSERVIGLVLTYVINYGLSYRKTSQILKDVHGVSISSSTIYRYVTNAANTMEHFVENFDYNLSSEIGADETYVKVKGKNKYVFFYSDINKKIITSYKIFNHRSSKECLISMFQTFRKFKDQKIPIDLSVTVDANPIYMYCQNYFKHHGINFDLRIVTGVANYDESSIKYRKGKQIQERLNRTYKSNYQGMNGYNSLEAANRYMVLFVTFFNFLRTHSSLNNRCPVELDFLNEHSLMNDKWISLINYSISNQVNLT